jgi:hypothetical protein
VTSSAPVRWGRLRLCLERVVTLPLGPVGRSRLRWIAVLAVLACAVVMGTFVRAGVVNRTVEGSPRMIGPHRYDDRFPGVDPVSGGAAEWVTTICQPFHPPWYARLYIGSRNPVYLFPNKKFALPGATSSAVCRAQGANPSEPDLLVARYPAEDPMQADLARNGVKWYCFAVDHDALTVFATTADDRATSPTGWNVSPLLEPLEEHFGFNVYSGPGH